MVLPRSGRGSVLCGLYLKEHRVPDSHRRLSGPHLQTQALESPQSSGRELTQVGQFWKIFGFFSRLNL